MGRVLIQTYVGNTVCSVLVPSLLCTENAVVIRGSVSRNSAMDLRHSGWKPHAIKGNFKHEPHAGVFGVRASGLHRLSWHSKRRIV